jgi:hypothetical protein
MVYNLNRYDIMNDSNELQDENRSNRDFRVTSSSRKSASKTSQSLYPTALDNKSSRTATRPPIPLAIDIVASIRFQHIA